jgi:hypothetical protein
MRTVYALTLFTCLASSSSFVLAADAEPADECSGPCIEYSGSFDLGADWLMPRDNAISDSIAIGPSIEHGITFKPVENFSIISNFVTEPVVDGEPGQNQIFTGIGSYADILQAQLDIGGFSIFGGKFHPAFGRAWDITPGLRGTDIAENYELAERLGGGARYNFETLGFANSLEASAFTVDRTFLSESLFTNRGRTSLDDGGAGNTKGVSSFAVSLGGCMGAEPESCYDDGSFGYQIAARYQKGGADSDGNEFGVSGGLNPAFTLSEEVTLRLFGEAAWFRNFEGTVDDALIATASAALEIEPFTYSLVYAQQRSLVTGGADAVEHLIDATVKYDLGESVSLAGEAWSIEAGYAYDEADGEVSHTVGLKLSAEFDTKIPLNY